MRKIVENKFDKSIAVIKNGVSSIYQKRKNMKIIGYTDQCTECECCGKKNLKGTFVMLDKETNEEYYYGSSCAFKAFGIDEKVLWSEVRKSIKNQIQDLIPIWLKSGLDQKAFLQQQGLFGKRYGKGKFDIITQFI